MRVRLTCVLLAAAQAPLLWGTNQAQCGDDGVGVSGVSQVLLQQNEVGFSRHPCMTPIRDPKRADKPRDYCTVMRRLNRRIATHT